MKKILLSYTLLLISVFAFGQSVLIQPGISTKLFIVKASNSYGHFSSMNTAGSNLFFRLGETGDGTSGQPIGIIQTFPTKFQIYAANDLSFYTNTSEKMRVTSDGNVGIGTTTPSAKLQVTSAASSNTATFINTNSGYGVVSQTETGTAGSFNSTSSYGVDTYSGSGIAINAANASATAPVAQFTNLSGGTALNVVASTAINLTGAIKVSGGTTAQTAFKITTNTAAGGNTSSNSLTIPNTTLANNLNDILIVTHNYSPNSTYLNKAFGVYWDGANWRIYLEDVFSAMPNNITFNVLVIKQ